MESDRLLLLISVLRLDSKKIVIKENERKRIKSKIDFRIQCVGNNVSQIIYQSREFLWEELFKEQQNDVIFILRKFLVYKRKIFCEFEFIDVIVIMEDIILFVNFIIFVKFV